MYVTPKWHRLPSTIAVMMNCVPMWQSFKVLKGKIINYKVKPINSHDVFGCLRIELILALILYTHANPYLHLWLL